MTVGIWPRPAAALFHSTMGHFGPLSEPKCPIVGNFSILSHSLTTLGEMRELLQLAAPQSGVVTRIQLLGQGMSTSAISRLLVAGVLVPLNRGAFCVASTEVERRQRVVAAALSVPDANVDDADAAEFLQLEKPRLDKYDPLRTAPIHLAVRWSSRSRQPDFSIRRQLHRARTDTVRRHGVEIVSATRLVIDMAGKWPQWRVSALLDSGLRTQELSLLGVAKRHESLPRRGRAGVRVVDHLLADRSGGRGNRKSTNKLEADVWKLLSRSGLPDPVPQYCVKIGTRSRYLDFAYPELRIAIEVDGYTYHSQRSDWASDQIRNNELVALGWRILRVTSEVFSDPARFLRQVAELYATMGHFGPLSEPKCPIFGEV